MGVSFVTGIEEIASSEEKTVSIVERKRLKVVQGVSFTSRVKRAVWSDHSSRRRRASHVVESIGDGNCVGLARDKLELSLDLLLLAFEIRKLLSGGSDRSPDIVVASGRRMAGQSSERMVGASEGMVAGSTERVGRSSQWVIR